MRVEDAREGRGHPGTVYFFGTCLVDLFYPETGLAGIELLRREGLNVVFPRGQTCCGQPAFSCGYPEEARSVARAQVRLFPGPWPVILPSGSCAGMMKRHYPELFAGEPDEAVVAAFSARVHELTEFLVDVLRVTLVDRGAPVKVAWHASCHAVRECGVTDQPKRLLAQLANVEVSTLARERECCGFGGTFAVRYADVSGAMVTDKIADVRASGATEVLSGDCGCLMNIGGALEAGGGGVRPRHVADFLLERTRAG